MARSIYLIRHGRTAYNAQNRFQGQVDIPLDEVGVWQADRTGEALRELLSHNQRIAPASGATLPSDGTQFNPASSIVVVSSDLSRATQTAHAFADSWGLEVHLDKRLRERAFGDWEGVPLAQAEHDFPEDFRLWRDGMGGELRHGAESRESLGTRGMEAVNDWASRVDDDQIVMFFSHGACIAETIDHMLEPVGTTSGIANFSTMRNDHWAELIPFDRPGQEQRWRLLFYNRGPAAAMLPSWDDPFGQNA
ncbi:MAG: histidine phosphatase family protein [Bifidobacteriaceae bacterium]|nr:histidine phosphatase family protein [Bifidobacteriaceae bacterium]